MSCNTKCYIAMQIQLQEYTIPPLSSVRHKDVTCAGHLNGRRKEILDQMSRCVGHTAWAPKVCKVRSQAGSEWLPTRSWTLREGSQTSLPYAAIVETSGARASTAGTQCLAWQCRYCSNSHEVATHVPNLFYSSFYCNLVQSQQLQIKVSVAKFPTFTHRLFYCPPS